MNRNISNWRFKGEYNKMNKRKLLAAMIHVATEVMMKTSCYTFGGNIFVQTSGSGIGLRASACIAKIIMAIWDKEWAQSQLSWGLIINLFMRYIDDLRLMLYPIEPGWYWTRNGWWYDSEKEDTRDPETRTKEECQKSLKMSSPS